MSRIIGQRWEVYDYNKEKDTLLKKGEKVIVKNTPDYGDSVVELISNLKDRSIESLYMDWKNGVASPFRTSAAQDIIDAKTLKNAKDYADEVAKNEWLKPVNRFVELQKTGLSNKKNYLCKVIAEPTESTYKSGIYQAVAGWTSSPQWTLFDDSIDLVNEQELAKAVRDHNTDQQSHNVSLSATVNEDTDTTTQEVSNPIANILQTIWNKIRSVVNLLRVLIADVDVLQDLQDRLTTAHSETRGVLGSHINNANNPHGVTKEQVGLGSVTNDAQVTREEMGVSDGVATLDENGQIPAIQIPNLGQGMSAVVTDSSLQGNGTQVNPLRVKLLDSSIIYSAQDNLEDDLRTLYGGTWKKITKPAPSVMQVGEAQNVSLQGSTGQTISSDAPGETATVTVSAAYNNNGNSNSNGSSGNNFPTGGYTISDRGSSTVTISVSACAGQPTFTLRSSRRGVIGTLVSSGTFASVFVEIGEVLYIEFTGQAVVSYSWVGYNAPYSLTLISSIRGELQTIGGLTGSGTAAFNSVILTADEILSAKINAGSFNVKWEWVYRYPKYEYVRIGD
jgi:hypothetical protein